MPIRCLYCDEMVFANEGILHYLLSSDPLCYKCRSKLTLSMKTIHIGEVEIKTFYLYDECFRSLILQYKEGFDEALKDCFLYPFQKQIALCYHGYTLTWIPSSSSKLKKRGFDHMAKMTEKIKLRKKPLLYKIEDISQSGNARYKMKNNFACLGNDIPSKILLIDDVITTGSSFYGAYHALKRKDNVIKCIAVAHSAHFLNK